MRPLAHCPHLRQVDTRLAGAAAGGREAMTRPEWRAGVSVRHEMPPPQGMRTTTGAVNCPALR